MLALALELYLKSIKMALGLPVPKTHDLWSLYNSFPANIKSEIESTYNELNKAKGDGSAEFQVISYIAQGNEVPAPPKDDFGKDLEGLDIKSVLKRNSHSFVVWRYFHEGGTLGEYSIYRYEFLRMNYICDSVRALSIKILKEKNA